MQQTSPGSVQPAPAVPAYLQPFYEILGKIGEGTYGVVFLARVRGETEPRMLAIKTFKPGKVVFQSCGALELKQSPQLC